jgi:uncharacterized protein with HEPN domain
MTKLEIIEEVLGTYIKNPKLRGIKVNVSGSTQCVYHNLTDGTKCAVGMCMTKEAIEKIERYTSDLSSWEELKEDVETFDACLMNFVIIGESVLRLDIHFIEAHPQIEWHKIRGFRNLIAHDYFGIDVEEVWDIIITKIPTLKQFITEIM